MFRAMNRFSYLNVLHVVEHEIPFEVQNVVLEECRMSGQLLKHERGESPQNVRFAGEGRMMLHEPGSAEEGYDADFAVSQAGHSLGGNWN